MKIGIILKNDKVQHLAAGFLLMLILNTYKKDWSWIIAVALWILAGKEIMDYYNTGHTCDWIDLVAGILGVVCGIIVLIVKRGNKKK